MPPFGPVHMNSSMLRPDPRAFQTVHVENKCSTVVKSVQTTLCLLVCNRRCMHSWVMPTMEEFIHQQNLERYRKMPSEKTHEPQRQTILQLLADEETRDDALSKLWSPSHGARECKTHRYRSHTWIPPHLSSLLYSSFCYLAAAGTAADDGTKRGYEPIEINSRD
jgi:hypothetical protein